MDDVARDRGLKIQKYCSSYQFLSVPNRHSSLGNTAANCVVQSLKLAYHVTTLLQCHWSNSNWLKLLVNGRTLISQVRRKAELCGVKFAQTVPNKVQQQPHSFLASSKVKMQFVPVSHGKNTQIPPLSTNVSMAVLEFGVQNNFKFQDVRYA